MGFLTPALLVGTGLVVLPILLHLIMRRQPRQLTFPALQFVKRRQEANRRRLNLRHLLLLALRCLLIAGIAIALARPVLRGSGLKGKEGAPLAVGLVVDNSLRMQYVEQNQTRLRAAAEAAGALVEKLPADSELAIVDLSRNTTSFVIDSATAKARLQALTAETNPRPLADAIRNAVQLVAEETNRRQEVFVFCDLTAADFEEAALAAIQQTMDECPEVRVYLIDLSATEPRNVALAPLKLNSTGLLPGEPLRIEAELASIGYSDRPLVEVFLLDSTGREVKRGEQLVTLDAEGRGHTEFVLGDLSLGTQQGYVQLAVADPLEFDNRRYFTVEVRPGARVLLLGETASDTLFVREALSPSLLKDAQPRFDCTVERFAGAANVELADFDAVLLLDPPPLADPLWNQLLDYVRRGGGLGTFLGHRATLAGFNTPAAQQILPGTLKLRSREPTWFRPQRLDHPALAGLRNYAEEIPWQIYPIWISWEFGDWAENAYVVARYANNQAALVERPLGQGRTLMLTTPVSDPLEPAGRESWNMLPTGPEPWPFVALVNHLTGYLAQSEAGDLNYWAGDTVSLRLSPRQQVTDYVLKEPGGEGLRRTLPPGEDSIRIGTTRKLGNYRVVSGGRSGVLDEGFSINAAAVLSRLERADPQAILAALPRDRVHLASTLEDVEQYVDIGRSGRELYGWAILLVALVWGSEHLLANRFYRGESPS
jgi:hypothetical protein